MRVVTDRCGTIGAPMDGAMIGQYRVTGVIGRGGMGAVYAAEHALLGRPAAIEVLLPELSQKQDVVMRFFNEARAATAIRHPGIIEIYDFGWTPEGAAFIVMEHLEGETLGRRAQRSRFLWQAALAIARQIAGALGAAHAKGIVHRDLKPDNVFVVSDPEVPGGERIKLLDFGIAKLAVDTPATVNVTRTGAVMGTPTYMAPEQCRGVAVDHRADLYALGCVIYELCCGRPPYTGEGSGDVLAAHIHLPIPEMTGTASKIPVAVERLVKHLLAKAPADRTQSAEELIQAIDGVLPERVGMATGPGTGPPPTSPSLATLSGSASTSMLMTRSGRRSRWSVVAFSAVLALAAAGVVVLVMRGGDGPARPTSHATEAAGVASGGDPSGAAAATAPQPETAKTAPRDTPPGAPGTDSPAPSAARDMPSSAATDSPSAPSGAAAAGTAPSAERAPPASRDTPSPAAGDSSAKTPEPPATIDVDLETVPAGAQVVLDGTVLGTTPYHGALPRRDRDVKLVVRLAGHVERTVVARGTRPITEHLKLARVPAAPAPPPPRNGKSKRDQSVNPF